MEAVPNPPPNGKVTADDEELETTPPNEKVDAVDGCTFTFNKKSGIEDGRNSTLNVSAPSVMQSVAMVSTSASLSATGLSVTIVTAFSTSGSSI